MNPTFRTLGILAIALATAPPALAEPTGGTLPNLEGTIVPSQGQALFAFSHRISTGASPTYTVGSIPSFNLLAGATDWLSLGVLYATKTFTVANASQELEVSAKQRALDEGAGAPLSLSLKEAFNITAMSPDLELAAVRTLGPLELTGALRGFGNFHYSSAPGLAAGLGLAVHVLPNLQVIGDAVYPAFQDASNPPVAWGGGLRIQIPNSPHTLLLQASNAATDTLQGASTPTSAIRYGFSFIAPLNPLGWLPSRPAPVVVKPADTAAKGAATEDPAIAAAVGRGGSLFQNNCSACHGAGGAGGFAPNLHGEGKKGAEFIAMTIVSGTAKGMPSFKTRLSAEEVVSLAAYVKRL